jgi:hypothetical protein
MRFFYCLISICILLLPINSYAHNKYFERIIRNSTDVTWIIRSYPRVGEVQFDHSFNRGPDACAKGSSLINGPCYLPPGEVTYVKYVMGDITRSNPVIDGTLIFIAEDEKKVKLAVRYWARNIFWGEHLKMKSNNETKINDNHGDITIFPGANR